MDDKSVAAFAIFQLLKQCFNVSQTYYILFSRGLHYNTSISSNDKPVLLAIIS